MGKPTSSMMRLLAVPMMAIMIVLTLGTYTSAHAESLEELAQKVEETSATYNDAVAEQERLAAEIESATAQITEIEASLPEKQEKAANVIAGMYRAGTSPELDVLNAVLGAKSFSDAIRFYEDYNKILDYTSGVVSDAVNAKHDLEDTKAKLEEDKAAQDAAVTDAKAALDAAIAARTAAQAKAKAEATGSALAGDIDWTMPRDEFVAHWGGRINNYLSGTPLAGNGETFADAAYQNGADPRWSPAISRIESGCGAHCFRSYNAWGWMSHSFSSWSEGIYAHVKYLAGPLYGGYLTMKAAQTYCPPTAGDWYAKVSREMSRM